MTQEEKLLRERLETRDFQTSFLVEAGAGAGKSHTICQRILHQLAAGQPPETIVAITFTEKATLELKEKLDRQALDYDARRGTGLAELAGRVHISTIHGFCRRVLGLFPLESGCGLDVPRLEPEERRRQGADFFNRRAAEDPDGAFARYEAFGGSRWQLREVFLDVAADGAVPAFQGTGEPGFQSRRKELDQLLRKAHQSARGALLPKYQDQLDAFPDELAGVIAAPGPGQEELRILKQTLRWAWKAPAGEKAPCLLPERVLFSDHPRIRRQLEEAKEQEKDPAVFSVTKGWLKALEPDMPRLVELDKSLGCDLAMAAVAPAAEAFYKALSREERCAPDDLLRRARDLVRDVPAVRAPLRERFQVFYVDEFQDTDPIQAEFLFLLTHGVQDGEKNWERCRPAPGSLFLVGDPKQAIYRFRGADLGIYKRVKGLFQGGVGQVVQLAANFRSNAQICAFTDLVFDPNHEKTPTSANSLNNDSYQAEYAPMVSEQGDAGRPMVFKFRAAKESDARFIAELIDRAVRGGYRLRDRAGVPVPLCYGDFLLLTHARKSGALYLQALSERGIPAAFSGDQSPEDFLQTEQLACWLRWLLEPDSELAMAEVLVKCFGLEKLGPMRRLKEAYDRPLTSLVFREEDRAALTDPALAPAAAAAGEMARVLKVSRDMGPQAFLDWLLEEQLGRSRPPKDEAYRQREYGCLRQLAQRVRSCPGRGRSQVLRFALEQCRESMERDLSLSPAEDCVRVMNLHKAKGLEGRVVILANDSGGRFSPTKAGGRYPVFLRSANGVRSGLYLPEDWQEVCQEEKRHYEAERVRLNYVAATRAEQLLLISCHLNKNGSEGGSWSMLTKKLQPLDPKKKKETNTPEEMLKAAFEPPAAAPRTAPAAAPGPVSDLVDRRAALIEALSAVRCRHVSPSTLDRSHYRPAPPDQAEQTELPPQPEEPEEDTPSAGSMGADWGTMVHRVMELYVRLRPGEEEASPLLRQAIGEVLPLVGSGRRHEQLFGGQAPPEGEEAEKVLEQRLWESTRFWFNPEHPLRRLADGGLCCAEYPFRLYLDDPAQPGQRLIARCLGGGEEFSGPVSVSGILDLAILREGRWHIVDYKTDHIRPGESREEYRARLTDRHRVQLEAYRSILTGLTGREVASLQLCAIPLGGELVPIPEK